MEYCEHHGVYLSGKGGCPTCKEEGIQEATPENIAELKARINKLEEENLQLVQDRANTAMILDSRGQKCEILAEEIECLEAQIAQYAKWHGIDLSQILAHKAEIRRLRKIIKRAGIITEPTPEFEAAAESIEVALTGPKEIIDGTDKGTTGTAAPREPGRVQQDAGTAAQRAQGTEEQAPRTG